MFLPTRFSCSSITHFLFNFDLTVSARPLFDLIFLFALWNINLSLIQQNIQTHIDYLTALNFVLF